MRAGEILKLLPLIHDSRNSSIRSRSKSKNRCSIPRIKRASEDSFEQLEKTSRERGEKGDGSIMADDLISQEQCMGCYGLQGYGDATLTGRWGFARDAERGPLHRVPEMWVHASLIAALCTNLATLRPIEQNAQIGRYCHLIDEQQASIAVNA